MKRRHTRQSDARPFSAIGIRNAETLLERLRCAQSQNIPDFRLAAAQAVVENALDEVNSLLADPTYTRDLSIDEAFIARTRHLFAAASAVYATSVDTVSTFWVSPQHRIQAEAYTAAQPVRTIRLFVFSSPASAHQHRNVLKAHATRYNRSGAVLLCTQSRYKRFLADLQHLAADPLSLDFALLLFREEQPIRIYEAVLSHTTLTWLERAWNRTTYEPKLIREFDSLAKIEPGDIHDGFLRWQTEFGEATEPWKAGLERLFLSDETHYRELQNGDVFHIVFFAADIDQKELTSLILREVKGKLELLQRHDGSGPLIKELWFGSRTHKMTSLSVNDGRYHGSLNTKNQLVDRYPLCIILRFSSIDDLREYYEHETHSSVRQEIYSLCSKDAKYLYDLISNPANNLLPLSPKIIYQAIEAAVDDQVVRADYMEHDTIDAIVQRRSAPFALR